MKYLLCLLSIFFVAISCEKSDGDEPEIGPMYFPPAVGKWEEDIKYNLNWNKDEVQALKDYLGTNGTKSFMILYNGKIVMEEYFNGHDATKTWPWYSAGQTLTSAAVGIAQQDGLLDINDKVSKHLGEGWTSETLEQENLVKIKNLLNMTSGINDQAVNLNPVDLSYQADAETRWSYHIIYEKLHDIIAKTSGKTFDAYLKEKIADKIGMTGTWDEFYSSDTRSMARFGLLALNKGKWSENQIINEAYFNESISTSQTLNLSFGYLWWLGGKNSFIEPNLKTVKNYKPFPNAPADMYMAYGFSDQRIYVSPSKRLVVVRMGNLIDGSYTKFNNEFDNEVWGRISTLID